VDFGHNCVQSEESAFFRLSVTTNPSPETGMFGLLPEHGQGSVSVSLVVWKPEFLDYIDPTRRLFTVTVRPLVVRLRLTMYR